jgi:hypothetical protein
MGQNGVLTGGVLAAALLCLTTRPVLAGVLAGLLCIKPPIGFVLPAVLLHARRVNALWACGLSVLALCGLSAVLEGWQAWQWYITIRRHSAVQVLTTPFQQTFLVAGSTVFFMLRSFNASLAAAYGAQGACGAAALILTWILWRRPTRDSVAGWRQHYAWPA